MLKASLSFAFAVLMIGVGAVTAFAQGGSGAAIVTRAKNISVVRTRSGFELKGELETTNGCMRALFVASEGRYEAVEERRPGTEGDMCTQVDAFNAVTTSFVDDHPPEQLDVQVKAYVVAVP